MIGTILKTEDTKVVPLNERSEGAQCPWIIGEQFDIGDSAELQQMIDEFPASRKYPITVTIDGVRKAFSIEEFKKCLGFN